MTILYVMAGASIGAALRFVLTLFIFPTNPILSLLCINMAGSTCMGFLMNHYEGHYWAIPFFGMGVLSGFTTFSTFSHHVFQYVDGGNFLYAFAYIMASVVLCTFGYFIGARVW